MSKRAIPKREAQALRDIGRTEVTPALAIVLAAAFLATLSVATLLQTASDLRDPGEGVWPRLRSLTAVVPDAFATARHGTLRDGNRALQEAIVEFEDRLEKESVLRDQVLPVAQAALTRFLGVGNEQAYLGRDGWLFFRADFDHVTGNGFLEPAVVDRAHLAGDRAPDPLPAILALHEELAMRGIRLVVMPTPVKPSVHPEFFTSRADPEVFPHNASFGEFVERLESAGTTVFDPLPVLAAAKISRTDPLYLRTDTHWTPAAMDLVAGALADRLEDLIGRSAPPVEYRRRTASVRGRGDIAAMLFETDALASSEETEISPVVTPDGRTWRPSPDAEVLLLGDSFTNVYSDPNLGWGNGAGLAEQLSFHLGRPVDRIALNAGGALASRRALQAIRLERLEPKRLVIYQFATRELSTGDWSVIPTIAGESYSGKVGRPH